MTAWKPLMLQSALSLRSATLALAAATLILATSTAIASNPSHSVVASKYAELRKQLKCDLSLTYSKVQSNPSQFTGRVLELAGKIGGSSNDGVTASIVLVLADDSSASLNMPAAVLSELQDEPQARLRVLVQVEEAGNSNLAPLKVISYTHEFDLRALERAESARNEAKKSQEERRQESEARWREQAQKAVQFGQKHPVATVQTIPTNANAVSMAGYLSKRAQPLYSAYYSYIAQTNERLDANAVAKIAFHLLNFADRYDVDPRLVVAMILAESHFNPNATSHSGAMGLGQLMPGTARSLGVDNPYDPVQNLGGSINYLRSRLDTFADKALPGGALSFEQVSLAMAAYNAGVNKVKKYNGIPPYTQTQNYVRKVTSIYQQLCR